MFLYVYRKVIFLKSLYVIVCIIWKINNSEVIEFKKKDILIFLLLVWYINLLYIIN